MARKERRLFIIHTYFNGCVSAYRLWYFLRKAGITISPQELMKELSS